MVVLTKLIINNIKNIKKNYIFFDLNLNSIFEEDDIYKTEFNNDFIHKIIKVYEETKYDENSSLDDIFGKFLKKIKEYLNYLLEIENKILKLNNFLRDEYIRTNCSEVFYKLNEDDKLNTNKFEYAWY